MIVITITVEQRSYIDRIPDRHTRIKRDPEYYRDVQFKFNGKKSLEKYHAHFVYEYLKNAYQNDQLPGFIVNAGSMEITLKHEEEL